MAARRSSGPARIGTVVLEMPSSNGPCGVATGLLVNDLRSLWEVELPESPEHQGVRLEGLTRRMAAERIPMPNLDATGDEFADTLDRWLVTFVDWLRAPSRG